MQDGKLIHAGRWLGAAGVGLAMAATAQGAIAASAKASLAAELQRIEDVENRRVLGDQGLLADLQSPETALAARALIALGRIGDPASTAAVLPLMTDPRPLVRREAAFALGLLGGNAAASAVSTALGAETDEPARISELTALSRVGATNATIALAAALHAPTSVGAATAAAEGLGTLWRSATPPATMPSDLVTDLYRQAQGAEPVASAAAFALGSYRSAHGTLAAAEVLKAFEGATSQPAKALLARVVGHYPTADAAQALNGAYALAAAGTRVELLGTLTNFAPADAAAVLALGLADASAEVQVQALTSLQTLATSATTSTANGAFGASTAALTAQVAALTGTGTSDWVRGTALSAYAALAGETSRAALADGLRAAGAQTRAGAIQGYATLGTAGDVALLTGLCADQDAQTVEAAINALSGLPAARLGADVKTAVRAALLRQDEAITALVADAAADLGWADFAPDLATNYTFFLGKDYDGTRIEILNALAQIGSHAELTVVDAALSDPVRLVVIAAAAAHKALTGEDVSARIPVASTVTATTPSAPEIIASLNAQVAFVTTRGEVRFAMLGVAPLTAYNFVKLARYGFYNGTPFHRIVPDFVAQGGDPRGDGYGGPGYLIREEISAARHLRGTVGMATDGKDTGGSQFFVNTAPNLHLDGAYTVFARVVAGMDVVDELQQGDVVLQTLIIEP